ncbi:hypothetical protein QFZ87_000612 [Bacillus sp. SLBN-46]|jgi:hypothetical protein|uniref:hypothetical protein n=1 Tax=Bacillus sp. SLBN-46 TaxID=3042283 RepID=UPI00285D2B23|nr:hypothetical protein [Bacillus sp. SLBN-46]MDR6121015.1 hypothetical protein [Bacillus sp. SLBN-46]
MKQVFGMKSLVAVGIGASAAMWLSSKPNRVKAETVLREWKRKVKPTVFEKSEQLPIEKGGHPHPHDVEDNNMVSEGAMYSVQFYNEKIQ